MVKGDAKKRGRVIKFGKQYRAHGIKIAIDRRGRQGRLRGVTAPRENLAARYVIRMRFIRSRMKEEEAVAPISRDRSRVYN